MICNLLISGSFTGFRFEVVDAGTVITDKTTGQQETVTENGAVAAGHVVYLTSSTYNRLKSNFGQPGEVPR